jgi:hypothetical protein
MARALSEFLMRLRKRSRIQGLSSLSRRSKGAAA